MNRSRKIELTHEERKAIRLVILQEIKDKKFSYTNGGALIEQLYLNEFNSILNKLKGKDETN